MHRLEHDFSKKSTFYLEFLGLKVQQYLITSSQCKTNLQDATPYSKSDFNDWDRCVDACPLYRHSKLYHQGARFPVSVRIRRNCYGDPTAREIAESVLIDELTPNQTMNGKTQWTYVKLNKISLH